MKTVIYKNYDQNLLKEWRSLWKKSDYASYVNSPEWFLSVIEIFNYKKYGIIALYEQDNLLAIGALVEEKKYGIPCYTIAPGNFACGLPFLINLTDRKAVKQFTQALNELGNIFIGNFMDEYLSVFKTKTYPFEAVPFSLNYRFEFEKDQDTTVKIANRKKLLHEARFVMDKLAFKVFDGTDSEGLQTIYHIDEQSRKQTRGYSTFSGETIKKFYDTLSRRFQKDMVIGILYFEEKPIAYGMGFLIGSTFFYNQMAYLAEYYRYSPGKVLLVKLIEYLGTKKVHIFDFGSGDSFIKRLVVNEPHILYQIIMTKNAFVLHYLASLCKWRESLFERLSKHRKAYLVYKNMRGMVGL